MPQFTTSDGLSLHYTDAGSGLPILCLAGLTRTTEDFSYVTPHLNDVRLIKLDYRGRGRSDWDSEWRNYNLLIEARDMIQPDGRTVALETSAMTSVPSSLRCRAPRSSRDLQLPSPARTRMRKRSPVSCCPRRTGRRR